MKVSIMITTYNLEDSIDESINSVIQQEMPFSWELLIGDDGSSDDTVSIIKRWVRQYPENLRLFIMKRDEGKEKDGKRAARNRANLLQYAKGDFLIFLDGDDMFIGTEKIRKQVELLEDSKYSNCSCCAHNINVNLMNENKQYHMIDDSIEQSVFTANEYWHSLYFHTNTILFRKECKKMLLHSTYRDYLNDNFITYIIIQFGAIIYINKIYAQYNITGNGLWTGRGSVYGCFRNMIIYDLELSINPKMKKIAFRRHLYDFISIFKNYKDDDVAEITLLIKDLNPLIFPNTTLLAKRKKLKFSEKNKKIYLFIKVNGLNMVVRMKRIVHSLIKK